MQVTPIDNSPTKRLCKIKKFSMPTLTEEIQLVGLVKYEFEHRNFEIKDTSLEILDDQDCDAREENHDFLVENSSTIAVFSIEILEEKKELVVTEKYKFE